MTTNRTDPPPRGTTDKLKKGTAQLGRPHLEQSLQRALDDGPTQIGQQVRYVLAISQMINAESVTTPYPDKPMSVARARLAALSNMGETLTEDQAQSLIKDATLITDPAERAQVMVRLTLHLPPESYKVVVRDIWNDVQRIADPVVRARTLFELAPFLTLVHDEPATPSSLLLVIGQAQTIRNVEARVRSLSALAPFLPYAMSLRTFQRVLDEINKLHTDTQRSNSLVAIADKLPHELEGQALACTENIADPAERARALTALAAYMPEELRPRLRQDALEAINTITREEDRAQALMAFAPHLEYASENVQFPVLLERALSIAVAITRRHIRAQVLVILAPHLTLDLQGEALAAVHSLADERKRSQLLGELAPTLPPEMLVASLAVAHTMREQDSRVQALTVLAHYVPENARGQTMLDALAAASNLPHHYERVTALVGLVDILPTHLRHQALNNALESIENIENENARARALNQIGAHLPENLFGRALDIIRQLQDANQRLNAYMGIVQHLVGSKREAGMSEMFNCVRDMPLEYKRARALVSITPLLPVSLLREVEGMTDSFSDPFDRVSVYITLIQNLPHEQRPNVIAKAWTLLKRIDDGYDRASTLVALAPFLPDSAYKDLSQAASVAIRAITDEYDKASTISILAPLLADSDPAAPSTLPDSFRAVRMGFEAALSVPQQSLRAQLLGQGAQLWAGTSDLQQTYTLWQEIIRRLKTLPLADVLLCLGALTPLIRELNGKDGLSDVARILGVR